MEIEIDIMQLELKKRFLESAIIPYLEHKNAIVITGPRQAGKTSLLQRLYQSINSHQKIWYDLENPLHQKIFENVDYDGIFKTIVGNRFDPSQRLYVFLDEIQNFPEITKIIKYLIDHYKVKFFVTGSSSFYMKNLFPESLSGRKFIFNLHPLSFNEFLYFQGKIPDLPLKQSLKLGKTSLSQFKEFEVEFGEYMKYGGFPEVALTPDPDTKILILENIFKSFFEKDILQIAQFQDVREIRDLMLLLAQRIGAKLNASRLASELGVSRQKIYSYIEFLESAFIITSVGMYSNSISRQVVAGKKAYFLDTGLLNQISQVSEGQIFENSAVNILKVFGELSYFQSDKGKEIDFILNKKVAFEVKLTGTLADLKNLQFLSHSLGIEECFLLSKNFTSKIEGAVYPQCLE